MRYFWEENNRTHVKWLKELTFTIILQNNIVRILFLAFRYQSAPVLLSFLRRDVLCLKICFTPEGLVYHSSLTHLLIFKFKSEAVYI